MAVYTLAEMENIILELLREPGVQTDITQPINPPVGADFPKAIIDSEINMAIVYILMRAGLAPSLSEKVVTLPITVGLDYTLPADCEALDHIEYQLAGTATPLPMAQKTFAQFDAMTAGGLDLSATGYPQCYREPYGPAGARQIRFFPQPTYGNAGIAAGLLTITGTPAIGDSLSATITNGTTTANVSYNVKATDGLSDATNGLTAAINASVAVTGGGAFMSAAIANNQGVEGAIALPALVAGSGGNAYTYSGGAVGGMQISPTATTNFVGGGPSDMIWLYYTSLGTTLVNPTDVPGLPAEFHQGIVDRVLARLWRRKLDFDQVKAYQADCEANVKMAKQYYWEVIRAGQASQMTEEETESGLFGEF